MDTKLAKATEFLRTRVPVPPVVGAILGSGLGDFADAVEGAVRIPYKNIPGFPPPSTVVGHKGELVCGTIRGVPVAVMAGRIHFYEGNTLRDVVFPARLLANLGCRSVVVTNASGGVNVKFRAGDLMVITDHMNLFGSNPLIGQHDDDWGARFPDMSDAYAGDLRKLALAVAKKAKVPLRTGVYLGTHGPSFETPAEIRAFRALGADAVGMSTVPETIALNQMGVGVLGISCVTNMAAGVLKQPLSHAEVLETTTRVGPLFVRLLTAIVAAMGAGRSGDTLMAEKPRKAKKPAPRRKKRA